MPLYSFLGPKGQSQDIFFTMRDAPTVGATITHEGQQWRRVFTVPNAQIAVTIDPHSKADFVKKLDGKNDTIGETWARSEELSAKRRDKDGVDPVKESHFKRYAQQRRGKEHPLKTREKAQKLADETNKSKPMRDLGISVSVNV